MLHFTVVKTRLRAAGALAAAVAAATVLGTAAPASASVSSGDWTAVPLPTGYLINDRPGAAPVFCVLHEQFCMVMTSDSADIRNGNSNLMADAMRMGVQDVWVRVLRWSRMMATASRWVSAEPAENA